MNEDGSSVVGDDEVGPLVELSEEEPLDECVYDGEECSDEEVLPHLAGTEEHSDCDDDGDGADDSPDEQLLRPEFVEPDLLDPEVHDEACRCGEEDRESDPPLELPTRGWWS